TREVCRALLRWWLGAMWVRDVPNWPVDRHVRACVAGRPPLHAGWQPQRGKRSARAAATAGWTNWLMSPPSAAISRTSVEEMKEYFSEGVRNMLSMSGAN